LNEEHKVVGTIKDVFSLAMNDIWVVWDGKKEMLIPAVKAIVKRVDIGMKQIIIHDIEGLLE
jgi:16S rRNA processing protein RimM